MYVKGRATASLTAGSSASTALNIPAGAGGRTEGSFSQIPFNLGTFLRELTSEGSLNDSGGGGNSLLVNLECTGSDPFIELPNFPGVKYYRVTGFSPLLLRARLELQGDGGALSANTNTSTTISVALGTTPPTVVIEGPLVGGNPNSTPPLDSTVVVNNLSYDPDNQQGTTPLAGICAALWTINYPDGTSSTSSNLGSISY